MSSSEIDEDAVFSFFQGRAKKAKSTNPLSSVLYQDKNPQLARARDEFEKHKLKPMLALSGNNRVLDIGCGIGRWAEVLENDVQAYTGVDFNEEFIAVCKSRFPDPDKFHFTTLRAEEVSPETLGPNQRFDVVIISGLLIYLSDENCRRVADNIVSLSEESGALVLLREPLSMGAERFVLDRVWSEELEQEYSAIYRHYREVMEVFGNPLIESGFSREYFSPLFPDDLNNRKETKQHLFLFRR